MNVPVEAIASLVLYNWADEERDYNTEALEPGNSREHHIFRDLMEIQRWLEVAHSFPYVEPHIDPPEYEPEEEDWEEYDEDWEDDDEV